MQARSSDAAARSPLAAVAGLYDHLPAEVEAEHWLLRAYALLGLRAGPATVDELSVQISGLGLGCERAELERILCEAERDGMTLSLDEGHVHVLLPEGERQLEGAVEEIRACEQVLGAFLARCGEQFVLGDDR